MVTSANVPRRNERGNPGRENHRGKRGQRRGHGHSFNDAGPLRGEVATYERVIVRSGFFIVMVPVEGLLESSGMLGRADVVMPLRQMKRRHDDTGPRENQPEEGQSRGEGSKTTHCFDAMSALSSTASECARRESASHARLNPE